MVCLEMSVHQCRQRVFKTISMGEQRSDFNWSYMLNFRLFAVYVVRAYLSLLVVLFLPHHELLQRQLRVVFNWYGMLVYYSTTSFQFTILKHFEALACPSIEF